MNAAPALAASLESLGAVFTILAEHAVGSGRVAWLFVSPAASSVTAPDPVGLAIEETGTVQRLLAKNRSTSPVLLPSDLVVGGGKQTRTVERSVVVAAGSETSIPVRCVERKRWDPGKGAGEFRVEGTLSSVTRASFVKMKDRSLQDGGAYGLDQGRVWAEVKDELTRTGVASTTESYADFLRSTRRPAAARAEAYEAPPRGANAVALLVGADAAWVEVFPSEAQLRAQAPSMLEDFKARVDALGVPCATATTAIDEVWRAPLVAIDAVEGSIGAAYALRGARAVGSALVLDGAVAHVAAAVG